MNAAPKVSGGTSRSEVPDFDRLYDADPDPWQVGTSDYEIRKRQIVLSLLAKERYASAWDPACGTGHLVARLAERCDAVLATDAAPAAVDLTAALCVDRPQVTTRRLVLPEAPADSPAGFDLIVLAEFLYYLDDHDRAATLDVVNRSAGPTGEVLALHWRRHPHDGWLSGADMQTEIGTALAGAGWIAHTHLDEPEFVLDSWLRPPTA